MVFTCGMQFQKFSCVYFRAFCFALELYNQYLAAYRSHHEKLVIVDNQICFIGGLDLCFGRYDNSKHNVGDNPPTLWPGKDYYNPRYVTACLMYFEFLDFSYYRLSKYPMHNFFDHFLKKT